MTFEELRKLKDITAKSLTFTDDNIGEKMLSHPYFYHRYLDIYIQQKAELDDIDRKKKKIYQQKYDFFKFKNDFRLDSTKEIETYINGDKEYDDVCLEYNRQECVVTYLVELLDMIKKMSFSMGNYLKLREFLAGK